MTAPDVLVSGPWAGVRNTSEPYDDTPTYLQNASNMLVVDPTNTSGIYARPGVLALNGTQPIGLTSTTTLGNLVYTHTQSDGTMLTFAFAGGKMYSVNSSFAQGQTLTDVTPTNVAFRATGFLYATSLGGSMIVHDETAKPMVLSNLTSTPVTATPIELYTPVTLLSRGSTDTRVAQATFTPTTGVVAANTVGTALPAGTIPLNKWGVYRVTYTGSTVTITAGAANFTTGYASEASAIAAAPAVTNMPLTFNCGYFTVQTKVGSTFVGGTDALTGGASGNVANATNYYAGEGNSWSAAAQCVIYTGALFFIMKTALGVSVLSQIVWSEPNQPTVGYNQTNYANFWTLTQTGTSPIYALAAKNDGLFYARGTSWGVLTGAPGVNFANTATHDTVSYDVGCVASNTVQLYGNTIYFADAQGRAYRFTGASAPEPIWLNMRAVVDYNAKTIANTVDIIRSSAWAVIEPSLKLYILGSYITNYNGVWATSQFYVFDLQTGAYQGAWQFNSGAVTSIAGLCRDVNASPQVLILGATTLGITLDNRYVQALSTLQNANWLDNTTSTNPSITTNRLGYSSSQSLEATEIRALFDGYTDAVQAITVTPYATTSVGTVSPPSSNDGVTRAVYTPDIVIGRGIQVQLTPTTAGIQTISTDTGDTLITDTGVDLVTGATRWAVYRIEMDAVPSRAGVTDP